MKKSAKKNGSSKGRRYTGKEKEEVIAFVEKVNSEKGRGGQNAASLKFGVSPLTISGWLRKGISGGGNGRAGSSAPLGRKLRQMQELHDQIAAKEAELAKLHAKFNGIKATL